MTPFDSFQHEQERTEQQQKATAEAYLDGASNAALGYSPAKKDDDVYLAGYLERLKELIKTSPGTLQIKWILPQTNRFNYHDCDWAEAGEF
ncbi:hypothetical protein [Leptolyngbya sp. ST-U4]|uniref:hypothetical protein n=1 Tax=Leptolyngbya sp. ST-U4 TaxID=2933912 RepID=UPI00329A4E4B